MVRPAVSGIWLSSLPPRQAPKSYGHVRRAEQRAMISEWCGERIIGANLDAAAAHGPYHLIVNSIGGSALSAALTMLSPGGLAVLAQLIAEQKLRPHIAVEAAWNEIGAIARRLVDRAFPGKAVLHLA